MEEYRPAILTNSDTSFWGPLKRWIQKNIWEDESTTQLYIQRLKFQVILNFRVNNHIYCQEINLIKSLMIKG